MQSQKSNSSGVENQHDNNENNEREKQCPSKKTVNFKPGPAVVKK